MPSDAAIAALRDLEHHISLAIQFVAGLGFEAFRDDTRTVSPPSKKVDEALDRYTSPPKQGVPLMRWGLTQTA